jgi:guanosine-3',5'-bis(diphosphate) 3'-pyrophosphohydrolase
MLATAQHGARDQGGQSIRSGQTANPVISMPESLQTLYRPVLEAVAFAARAHHGQLRKDGQTPYVSHVFRVCLVLRDLFGVADRAVLTAAVLHDTLEDTTTDFDDLEELYGKDIAAWVAALSKDKRLAHDAREEAYCRGMTAGPWQVQVCKLADVFDNLMDSSRGPAQNRDRVLRNARRYLDALRIDLKEQAAEPWRKVEALYQEIKSSD